MKNSERICEIVRDIKVEYRQKIGLPKDVKFGTEIEFESAIYHNVYVALQSIKKVNKWLLKRDESVAMVYNGEDCGGEVVSPILHDTKTAWSDLKTACTLIKKQRGYAHKSSGAHIHIDSGILKDQEEYILNFIKLWMLYEHVIYRFVYGELTTPRRSLPLYAAPVMPYIYEFLLEYSNNPDKIYQCLNNQTIHKNCKLYYLLSQYIKDPNALNNGINFGHCNGLNSKELNTIEFRCPNGTLNHIVWQNNVNLFTKLLLYCTKSDFDIEFINKKIQDYTYKRLEQYSDIYLDDAIELANLVFDNELDKMYFLKQYLQIYEYNFKTIKEKALKR